MLSTSVRLRRARPLVAGLVVVLLAAFLVVNDPLGKQAQAASTVNVAMTNFQFTPKTITVSVGDTVKWTSDGGLIPHTATATSGATFDSGILFDGQTFSWQATSVGTIQYTCTLHDILGMRGTIVVASGSPTTTTIPSSTTTMPSSSTTTVVPLPTTTTTTIMPMTQPLWLRVVLWILNLISRLISPTPG